MPYNSCSFSTVRRLSPAGVAAVRDAAVGPPRAPFTPPDGEIVATVEHLPVRPENGVEAPLVGKVAHALNLESLEPPAFNSRREDVLPVGADRRPPPHRLAASTARQSSASAQTDAEPKPSTKMLSTVQRTVCINKPLGISKPPGANLPPPATAPQLPRSCSSRPSMSACIQNSAILPPDSR